MRRAIRQVTIALLLAVVAAACGPGSGGSPSSTAPSIATTEATPAPSTTDSTTGTTSPTTATSATATAPTTTDSTMPSPGEAAPFDMLVSGMDGVRLLTAEGEVIGIASGPIVMAADDLSGGFVLQEEATRWTTDDPLQTIVWWVPAGATAPQQLLVPTGQQWLSLVGVAEIDGSPHVVYLRDEGFQGPEDFGLTLRTMDLESRRVDEIAVVGGWESGADSISVGGGTIGLEWSGEGNHGFAFLDLAGQLVEVVGDPLMGRDCFDGTILDENGEFADDAERCFELPALDADGARLAYLQLITVPEGIDYQYTVVSTADGAVLYQARLFRPDQAWSPAGLVLHDGYLIVNRFEGSWFEPTELPALVVDLASGRHVELVEPGHAEPVRVAPSIGNEIALP